MWCHARKRLLDLFKALFDVGGAVGSQTTRQVEMACFNIATRLAQHVQSYSLAVPPQPHLVPHFLRILFLIFFEFCILRPHVGHSSLQLLNVDLRPKPRHLMRLDAQLPAVGSA